MVEAFAAAARQLEKERRERPSFTVILPRRFSSLRQWLFAPVHDPEHFGRKRRARRARGRRIEAMRNTPSSMQRVFSGGWISLAGARSGFRSHPLPKVMILDEIDTFLNPSMGEPWEWQAFLESRLSPVIVPCDQINFTCHVVPNGTSFEDVMAQQGESTDEADPHRR